MYGHASRDPGEVLKPCVSGGRQGLLGGEAAVQLDAEVTHPKFAHSHVHVVCKLNLAGKSIYGHFTELVIYIEVNDFMHACCTCFQDGFQHVVRHHGSTHHDGAGTEPWSNHCRASGIFESEV